MTSERTCGACSHWRAAADKSIWGECCADVPAWVGHPECASPRALRDNSDAAQCDCYAEAHRECHAAILRGCADLVRLVAPDEVRAEWVSRDEVVEIALRIRRAADARRKETAK